MREARWISDYKGNAINLDQVAAVIITETGNDEFVLVLITSGGSKHALAGAHSSKSEAAKALQAKLVRWTGYDSLDRP